MSSIAATFCIVAHATGGSVGIVCHNCRHISNVTSASRDCPMHFAGMRLHCPDAMHWVGVLVLIVLTCAFTISLFGWHNVLIGVGIGMSLLVSFGCNYQLFLYGRGV